ncbi:hypothetical protein C8R43DRAFT_984405 [Mycena crocata]|nr:hypothetical protein C8R43DRAFT_984405 [Mycena crocata]
MSSTIDGLSDLPTEILQTIFNNGAFPTTSLYFLALLSRRLHVIALPIFLSRNGMDLASNVATVTMRGSRQYDLFSGLRICLFLSSIQRVTFIIPHPNSISILLFTTQLRRMKQLNNVFSSVKAVTIELDRPDLDQPLLVGHDDLLAAWDSCFGHLLAGIIQRQCTSLTVVYGACVRPRLKPAVPAIFRKSIFRPLLPLTARGFRLDSRRVRHAHPSTSPEWCRSSQLTTLNIHSATLILPPSLYWTLAALRQSRLSSIAINMRITDADTWTIVLPLLAAAAPHVTTVSLTQVDVTLSCADVLTFLSRLPQLTDINIELTCFRTIYGSTSTTMKLDGPTPRLQNLVTLRAPARWVGHLMRKRNCFPSIQTICVVWVPAINPADQSHFETLAPLAMLSAVIRQLGARNLAPHLSLHIDYPMPRVYADLSFLALAPTQLESFDRLQTLRVTGPRQNINTKNIVVSRGTCALGGRTRTGSAAHAIVEDNPAERRSTGVTALTGARKLGVAQSLDRKSYTTSRVLDPEIPCGEKWRRTCVGNG